MRRQGEIFVASVQTQSIRYRRVPWVLAATSLAGLVFMALPSDRIRLGAEQLRGLVGSYTYRAPVPLPPVTGLRVAEVCLPGHLRIEWDDMTTSNAHYILRRINPATGAVLVMEPTNQTYWEEEADFAATPVFEYWVTLAPNDGGWGGGELPPPGATDIEYYPVVGPDSKLRFRIENVAGTDNQTVDSRYDLRFGNPTYLDYQFKNSIFRGGLYVGFANDPSRAARSFVKFPLAAGIEDGVFLNGSLNAFATALLTGQSVEVGAQKVSNAAWNPLTLKWTTAPSVDPTQAPYRFTFSGAGGWGHWSLTQDIADAEGATDPLTIALASTDEGTPGKWAYLAKKEYDASLGPRVLIARHYPGDVPAASSLAVQAVTSTTVSLTWNNPIAVGVSVLQMREGNGSWEDVATEPHSDPYGWWGGPTFPKSPLAGIADGLTPNTQYQFRVKCETQAYGDYYSQRVTATTAP